jgi:deoxyribodipyrimidine photolyase-related protein
MNNGLLHPAEVIKAAEKAFKTGKVPIESAEAFVRQIIGWREYVNGMYWFLGPEYRNNNQLQATRKLLPLFENPNKTQMNCIKSTVTDINDRAWVHHIPRLMLLEQPRTCHRHQPTRVPRMDAPRLYRRHRLGNGPQHHRHGRARR